MSVLTIVGLRFRVFLASDGMRVSSAVVFVGLAIVFLQGLLRFWGRDVAELPSAAVGWVGNYESTQTYFWVYLMLFVCPALACMLQGDALLRDMKAKRLAPVLARSSLRIYITGSALAAYLLPFLFLLLFGILSQLVALIVFPAHAAVDAFQISYLDTAAGLGDRVAYLSELPLAFLFEQNQYLGNLAYIVYGAGLLAVLPLASFAISLFVRHSRLLVVILPVALLLIASQALPARFNPAVNLLLSVSKASDLSLAPMLAMPVLCVICCVLAIAAYELLVLGDES